MKKFEGTTIDAALAAAATQLGIAKGELQYQVTQEPRHGFLGIGKRMAIIQVTVPKTTPQKEKSAQNSHNRPRQVKKQPTRHEKHEPAREKQAKRAQTKPLDEKEKLAQEARANHVRNLHRMQAVSKGLVKYLTDALSALNIQGQVKIDQLRVHDLKLVVETKSPSRVVGYHGRRINALESLGATYLTYHGIKDAQLVLDTGDYRERRRQSLKNLMADSVTEVIATNRAVFLDPMPARERKLLHKLAEKSPAVKTYSHGKEPFRSVVIAPRN